jgi:hypothetical protein
MNFIYHNKRTNKNNIIYIYILQVFHALGDLQYSIRLSVERVNQSLTLHDLVLLLGLAQQLRHNVAPSLVLVLLELFDGASLHVLAIVVALEAASTAQQLFVDLQCFSHDNSTIVGILVVVVI